MKQVYDYQEIGVEIDQGKLTMFTCHPVARVSVQQKSGDSQANPEVNEYFHVIITLSIGDTVVGLMEYGYASMIDLLDAFQIDDTEEIWEMLG